ncbi:MAG: DMT family transporter [Oscillospiraceae bacterium]
MSDRKKGVVLALTAASLWGIMGVFVRGLTSSGLGVIELSFFRCSITGALFFVYLAVKKPEALRVDLKGLVICLIYGAVAYIISFTSYSIAISKIPVAVATILMFLCPVWVSLISAVVFGEKPGKWRTIAIFVCLFGAALASDVFSVGLVKLSILGVLMGILNGWGAAMQILVPRYFADKYSKDTMLVYGFLGAAIVLGLLSDFSEVREVFKNGDTYTLIADLAVVSVLCTMVASISYVKSSEYILPTESSILSGIEVVVGSLAGYLIFNEHLAALQIIGMIIVMAGSLGSQLVKERVPSTS